MCIRPQEQECLSSSFASSCTWMNQLNALYDSFLATIRQLIISNTDRSIDLPAINAYWTCCPFSRFAVRVVRLFAHNRSLHSVYHRWALSQVRRCVLSRRTQRSCFLFSRSCAAVRFGLHIETMIFDSTWAGLCLTGTYHRLGLLPLVIPTCSFWAKTQRQSESVSKRCSNRTHRLAWRSILILACFHFDLIKVYSNYTVHLRVTREDI